MTELLEAVEELARLTGGVAQRLFNAPLEVDRKADGTVVSRADREAEAAARAWIGKHFPDDAILGEEYGTSGGSTGRTWVLDPIDGTVSYLAGVPLWTTLVALKDGDQVIAGAIGCPPLERTVVAVRDEGCWENGTRCFVSEAPSLEEALVITTSPRFGSTPEAREPWERLAARSRIERSWGDGFGYQLVATGRAEVMADAVAHPWDVAAPSIVVTEAGGVFTGWPGKADDASGLATNAELAEEVRRVLTGP